MEELRTNGKKTTTAVRPAVSELFEMMKAEDLMELEIKEGDYYVYLKRKGKESPAMMHYGMPVQQVMIPQMHQAQGAAVEAPQEEAKPKGDTVKSPIIGTFYRSPSPASPPFAKEGDIIEAGKTLCIIEAMKVMNEIKAETRIKVLKILVENGKSVTSDQDLFEVENA